MSATKAKPLQIGLYIYILNYLSRDWVAFVVAI